MCAAKKARSASSPATRCRKDERQVIEVTAITHRKNYIFQDVHAGYTEHKLMGAVPREAALIRAVRQTVPTVKSVCMPVSGNCRFHAYISIAKRGPGQPKNAICAAFAADMLLKHVVIVDDDIDVSSTKNKCSGRCPTAFKPTKIWLSLPTLKVASSTLRLARRRQRQNGPRCN